MIIFSFCFFTLATLTLANDNSNSQENNESKVKIQWFYLSSAHYLKASNNFTNPRPAVEFKSDKLHHLKQNELFNSYPRKGDIERIEDFFNYSKDHDAVKFDSIFLSSITESKGKGEIVQKIKAFFDDSSIHLKVMFITGVCGPNADFIWEGQGYNEHISISYDELKELWINREGPQEKKFLYLIVDCPFSGLWANKCVDNYDYLDISVQASSTDKEGSIDILNYGSLFLNNFIHSQFTMSKEFVKRIEENNKFDPESPFNVEDILKDVELLNKNEEKNLEELEKANITKYINTYEHKPSSCGVFIGLYKRFKLNGMFNSWEDMIKRSLSNYLERHHPEAKAYFVGEVIEGKPNGRGSLFYYENKEQYIGDLSLGDLHGRGAFYYNDSAIYEGYWNKNRRVKGVVRVINGDWYTGEFVNEAFEGQGTYYSHDKRQLYKGEFKMGLQDGEGITYFYNGGEYRGSHKNNDLNGRGGFWYNNTQISDVMHVNGVRNGKGWMLLKEGHNYTGMFVNGTANGKGTMKYKTGDYYSGNFSSGYPNGKGKFIYANGNEYEGQVVNGKKHGKGVLNLKNGDQYEGDFNNEHPEGYGTLYYEKGIYKGEFKKGQFHGKGTIQLRNGGRYEGQFKNGKMYREESDL